MSLECLAILGQKNEPLYVCSTATGVDFDPSGSRRKDAFGFVDPSSSSTGGDDATTYAMTSNVSVRHEFMLHAALDLLIEFLGPSKPTNLKRFQQGSNWLGCLCSLEEYDLYGYSTPTSTKIIALIQRDSIIALKKRREADIKALFGDVHSAFVKYTMNPFTNVKTKIEPPCHMFEKAIDAAIRKYTASAAPIERNEWREGIEL